MIREEKINFDVKIVLLRLAESSWSEKGLNS